MSLQDKMPSHPLTDEELVAFLETLTEQEQTEYIALRVSSVRQHSNKEQALRLSSKLFDVFSVEAQTNSISTTTMIQVMGTLLATVCVRTRQPGGVSMDIVNLMEENLEVVKKLTKDVPFPKETFH